MKMKQLSILLAALLLAALCGCGAAPKQPAQPETTPAPVQTEAPTVEPTPAPAESPAPEEPAQPLTLTVEMATEEALAAHPDHTEFVDAESEYVNRILIAPNQTVTRFRFLTLDSTVTEEGELQSVDSACRYEQPELTPDCPVVLQLEVPEIIPDRGIDFYDAQGNRHLYYIQLSGEDGHPYVRSLLGEE